MRVIDYNYWMNRTNYFGDGLVAGFFTGIVVGFLIGNLAAYMMIFTFLGGAIGSLIKRKRHGK